MSIATEISRLQTDRNTIRDKLIELGMATNTSNLTALAGAIEEIVNQGAVQVEILEGTSYTIPAGYHNGSGTVTALTDSAGESEKYKLQAKTITPTKNQQSITPDTGYYALSAVTVNAIPEAYQNVSSVTAEASNVLTGKIFVTADGKVTAGTMVNNGAVAKTLDGTTVTYTIPAGYHNGSGKVTIVLEEKSVTPTKATQTVTPTAGKVLSKVTVDPIPDNYHDTSDADYGSIYIVKDKVYYGSKGKVTGTMKDNGTVTLSLDANTSYVDLDGYYVGGSRVQTTLSSRTVTPTKSIQTVKPQTGCLFKQVTVNPIPDNYVDTTDATATNANILSGKTAYVNSAKVTGTMPNNGDTSKTINGLTSESVSIPAGYTSGGTISLTDDIEKALASI